MGHTINYSVYAENVNKDKVQSEWDAAAQGDGWREGSSGLPGKIRWLTPVMDSIEEAKEYIRSHDSGDYAQLAVQFRMPAERSAKTAELEERLSIARGKFHVLNQKPHFADAKYEFIGCKNCGSRIAVKYLKGNFCPVCHTDMRPETVRKRLNALSENIEKAEKAYQESILADTKKSKTVKWLVKTEYHT